jgi:hypothetical protein
MKTLTLHDLIARTEARKAALGIVQTPAEAGALRNKGATRLPQKRELLRRLADRAQDAGLPPVTAYW